MIRTYSILSTNGELRKSPYVNRMQKHFDILLKVGKPQVVNFLLQFPVNEADSKRLRTIYNKNAVEISGLNIESFRNQTIITTTLTAKEVGSDEIGFILPYRSRTSKTSLGAVTIEF